MRGLWRSRELLYFLIWRDVKVRYKQTILGAFFAVTAVGRLSLASSLLLRGVAAIIEAYLIYWAVVFVARFLEGLIEYLIGGGTLGGIPEHVAQDFSWHRFAAIQIWIFVLFLLYAFVRELNTRLGEGELARMLFHSGRERTKAA